MMKDRERWAFAAVMALALATAVYQAVVWHTYPCDAWKAGHLQFSAAPGRCVR